ncbi:hypothetical protein PUNSTDRAFT_123204 [Punctularia strigosozonata HHB-11173 SS5]|uniref:Chromatin assembly factor 1 subunit A dimerization domain-containing protein n=1 Tax=Punctularia strigosozonata (strain HHB-11173) TaxID=741275 RepID=R7S184_PUNST|nr:uncharacterized protein PUNSTDRAFT_123204 [Punctularia strigosozonata HHB-11173 SS5]EIN03604.1 hypothetical protein PUNSTDRAFT_123204 [Punctularia strigosozonata HHB-11173 SS5]
MATGFAADVGNVAGQDAKPMLIELKNGKAICKQKPIFYDKSSETMSELVKFRELLDERMSRQDPQLGTVPEEYLPLIAKLVQESDKAISALTKSIHQILLPPHEEDEEGPSVKPRVPISAYAVEKAINSVATRVNYGLDPPGDGTKVPAVLCVWRWEVNEDKRDWLPKAAREKADARLAERVQAKNDLQAFVAALPQAERDALFKTKQPLKDRAKAEANLPTATSDVNIVTAPSADDVATGGSRQVTPMNGETPAGPSTLEKKRGRPKKPVDPVAEAEKEAKEREKAEKRAEKEAKEREKVEKAQKEKQAQAKSRNIMANFFNAKPKQKTINGSHAASDSGNTISPSASKNSTAAGPSDFERTFKPFVLKKEAELAPINWFRHSKGKQSERKKTRRKAKATVINVDEADIVHSSSAEIIEILDEDIEMNDSTSPDLSKLGTREHLSTILSSLPASADPLLRTRPSKAPRALKTHSAYSVRQIMAQLSEAEVSGDDAAVRELISLLEDRTAIPARVFVFHEDARPGYYGTFTKTSELIGPRTPFAKDSIALDYGYDSGEEWEEEEVVGDDVHDGDEVEDDDADEEEQDSDLDSWLVDDDEIEEVGTPLSDRMDRSPSPFDVPPLPLPKKRKAEKGTGEKEKKRKVVVPLVPFNKGPCWESEIGRCEYEPFEQYRIQMFNDTTFPVDPFTFVSQPIGQPQRDGQALPALPALPDPRMSPLASTDTMALSGKTPKPGVAAALKPKPKSNFPEAHLPFLLSRITSMGTSSLIAIVEAVYADLKEHKVKKNAIEVKVREVGVKCKEKKIWVVKDEVKDRYPQCVS